VKILPAIKNAPAGKRLMKRIILLALGGMFLLFGNAGSSNAQVKKVQMHIAGYLCGN